MEDSRAAAFEERLRGLLFLDFLALGSSSSFSSEDTCASSFSDASGMQSEKPVLLRNISDPRPRRRNCARSPDRMNSLEKLSHVSWKWYERCISPLSEPDISHSIAGPRELLGVMRFDTLPR